MDTEDFDLYGDLDEALIEPLQEKVQKKEAEELEKQKQDENFRQETEKIINELKTSNYQLKKNMSLLLATAKSEIERKDQQMKDLRREMDEIIFRKNKNSKKTCDKWSQTEKVEFIDNNRSNSSRFNESNKLHDRNRPKDSTDSDRYKRKLSPERRPSDDYRRTSHRDDRNRNNDDRSRKSSHENNRSRSPEKHDKRTIKCELREDDLRKTLLKNKSDDKAASSSKESSKSNDKKRDRSSGRDKKDKYSEKDRNKEKSSTKNEKTDEKRDKKKNIKTSPKKVKDKGSDPKSVKNDVSDQKSSIEDVKKEVKDEEKLINPQTDKESPVIEPKIAITTDEKIDMKKTPVDEPAQEDAKLKNETDSINDLLTAETVKNEELPIHPEELLDKNEKEVKTPEIFTEDCKNKDEILVKTEEQSVPKKQKYVPIFEAKLYPNQFDKKKDDKKPQKTLPKEDDPSKNVQKFTPIDTISSTTNQLPIVVTIEQSTANPVQNEDVTIITEKITTPINEIIMKMKETDQEILEPQQENNTATTSPNDSFESTKENSLNNSFEKKKHKKRKITTEVEDDGTVVWTVTRKKRKTKEQS